jgi:uncharacterized protein (DUF427 family)
MTDKSHSATVSPAAEPYVAKVGDRVVARSSRARILQEVNGEKSYSPVVYFPLEDVSQEYLAPSDHRSFCPIKGEAGYYRLQAADQDLGNAAWFYPDPLPEVAEVKDHVAFYPDKVTVTKA